MAGESADAIARRHRERAERLQESARRWQQGADGERATASALAGLPQGWIVLHDLAWPGRLHANVDHVVIGPPGVVVVDSKNWSGRVSLGADGLRQNGRDRSTAAWGVEAAAYAVADAVPFLARDQARAALCLVGQGALSGFVGSVLVASDTEIVAALLARPAILTPREVWEHAESVRERLGAAGAPRAVRPQATTAPRTLGPPPTESRDTRGTDRRTAARHTSAGRSARGAASRRAPQGLGRALVAAGFLALLVFQPGLVHSAADEIARRITEAMAPADASPVPDATAPGEEKRRGDGQGQGRGTGAGASDD